MGTAEKSHPFSTRAAGRRSRREGRIRWGRLLLVGLTMIGLAALLFLVHRDPEPTPMLLTVEQYLNFARESRADLDAPEAFERAESRLGEARTAMRLQFGRPAFLRDYEETRRLLSEAHHLINESIDSARSEVLNRESVLRAEIEQIRKETVEVRSLLRHLPPEARAGLPHIVSAESRIWAAEAKLSAQESIDALESMKEARVEIDSALQGLRDLLVRFLERREEWNRDLEATLAETQRPGRAALVIDKLNHKAHLIRNGRRMKSYEAEFGPGWLEQKIREGDRATPEGRYRVARKRSIGQTRYHRAFLLDYPNDRDRVRFHELRAAGRLTSHATIGGLIEVHGEGGKGEDWTMGCISLRNEDMDDVFPQIGVGDQVTIVGLWDEPGWMTRALETASR